MHFVDSPAGLISNWRCPLGRVPLGVGTGLGAAADLPESRSRSCLILRIEGDLVEPNADKKLLIKSNFHNTNNNILN